MSDLAEIRRFWPHAGHWYLFGELYVPKPTRRYMLSATQSSDGSWYVTRYEASCTRMAFFDGPTIAAAMAAAGFAQRPIGRYRETFNQYADRTQGKPVKHRAWHARRYSDKPVMLFADTCQRHDDGTVAWPVLLESRQRPRKGVRLGKLKRWEQQDEWEERQEDRWERSSEIAAGLTWDTRGWY